MVVRNGFFEEDFTTIERLEPATVSIPNFSIFRTLGPSIRATRGSFFVALAELLRERPELKNRIRLHLVGFPCEEVLRYARESELKEITEFHGFLPRREDALQMMRSSDYLVVCWGRPIFHAWLSRAKPTTICEPAAPSLLLPKRAAGSTSWCKMRMLVGRASTGHRRHQAPCCGKFSAICERRN